MRSSFIVLIFMSMCMVLQAQQTGNFWTKKDPGKVDLKDRIDYSADIKDFSTFILDETALIDSVDDVPERFSGISSSTLIKMPDGKGGFINFKLYESNLLPASWDDKYTELRSFYGISGNTSLRLTQTPQGFYGMIQKPQGHILINPLTDNAYMVFEKEKAATTPETWMNCQFDEQLPVDLSVQDIFQDYENKIVDDGLLRTYELAVATTGEYAQFHISEADAQNAAFDEQMQVVLSAIAVTIDRVNSIYERDFAITLELIDENDDIVYFDESDDPYSNFSAGAMLSENQNNIDNVIGFSNYDIGHVFSTGGGGVASLGSVCTSSKARGVTGLANPIGDPFDIDYVAHEMGHQFGATHTFNNSCNTNRTDATAFEPGSGNTIMAYAGICPPNIQNNSDAVFHIASVSQVFNFIQQSSGSQCGSLNTINNDPPVINSPVADKTIPYGTPFVLEADATDPNNDVLTYNWEQLDNEISVQPPDSLSLNGPNFRSLLPKDGPKRFFPKYELVLDGALSSEWEVLPWTNRNMVFGVLIRDNNPLGGQTVEDIVNLSVADAGPFEVTSQDAEGINWQPGSTATITWNVNGTDANGINTAAVDILLSTDAGITYDTVLASNVTNDGSHTITVPDLQAAFCRLKVQPVDNYYYAINSTDFAIDTVVSNDCDVYTDDTAAAIPDGAAPNTAGSPLTKTLSISEDNTIESVEISVEITHDWINDLVIELESPEGTTITLWDRNCGGEDDMNVTFSSAATEIPNDCSSPFTGTFKVADANTGLDELLGESMLGDWELTITDFWDADAGTLESWSIDVCYTSILSTQEIEDMPDFSITPNPATDNILVRLLNNANDDLNIKFYDMNGRLVKTAKVQEQETESNIDISELSSGVYFIRVDDLQRSTTEKLIIR